MTKNVTIRRGKDRIVVLDQNNRPLVEVSVADSAHGARADLSIVAGDDLRIERLPQLAPPPGL